MNDNSEYNEFTANFERMMHHAELFSSVAMQAHLETVEPSDLNTLIEQEKQILTACEYWKPIDKEQYERHMTLHEFVKRQIDYLTNKKVKGKKK